MTRLRPLYLSAITFLVALAVGGAFVIIGEHRRNDERRQAVAETGIRQAHILERQLERSLSSTFALASVLRQSGGINDFDALAAEIMKNYGGISNLQLAPNGVVTQIYPLEGNQEAIGHDLLNDPERRTEALKAIESHQLTVAGPFTLIQGGVAVIGRFPVFVPDAAEGERFWGFTIALIRLPGLLEASDVKRLVEQRYDYELSRIDPDSGARVVFARSTELDLPKPIPFEIKVPNGIWTLAIAPRGGWPSSSSLPGEVVLVFLVSSLVAALTYRLLRQPAILRREVELRTRELAETNRDLEAEIAEHERTEDILYASEYRYRSLVETAGSVIISLSPDHRILEWNHEAERVYGWSREEVLGKDWFKLFLPEAFQDSVTADIEKVLAGQPTRAFESLLRRRDGNERTLLWNVTRLLDAGGQTTGVMAIGQDITELKRAEEALREREEGLRLLLETTNAIPWEANAKTWQFTYVGPQAIDLLGYLPEQWYEKDFWPSHIHPDDREYAIDFCRRSTHSSKDYEFEYRMVAADGRIVWVHDIVTVVSGDGVPETLRGFMIDITERKKVDEVIKKQRAFLRQVIDINPNFIFAKDREGRFTLVNQAVAAAYGTRVEDLIGKTDGDFNPSVEEVEFFRRMDQEVMDTLQEKFIPEEPITDAEGKLRWLQTVKRPIIDEDGIANQVLGSATDITDRKGIEEALRQSEAALRNSQRDLRMLAGRLLSAQEEERRRLARELHDDLTQRLAVLAIEVASLDKTLSSSPSTVRDRLRRIKEQMMKLSADVHGISRQLHPSILDDLGLVSAIESECAAFSERDGVRVTFIPDNVPAALPKDVSLCLYRVTQESLRNIAKHAQAKEAYVTLACLDEGVLLTIQDCGVGFDLAQAKGKAGLGLASMEERVRLLQGSLSIHSKPGQGTIIEVHAPLDGRDV